MDFEKENWWQIKRKPRFAGNVFGPDATPFRASNRITVGAHLDQTPLPSQSQTIATKKCYENQESSYSKQIWRKQERNNDGLDTMACEENQQKDYCEDTFNRLNDIPKRNVLPLRCFSSNLTSIDDYSSGMSERKKGIHTKFLDQRVTQEENTSKESSLPKHISKGELATQTHSSNVELGSSKNHSTIFSKTGMFRKGVMDDKMQAMRTKARARRSELMKERETGSSEKVFIPLRIALDSSVKKGNLQSSLNFERNRLPRLTSPKGNDLQAIQHSNDCEDTASSQECCRALCFDNIQEVEEPEDLTIPLDMMDMTAMISGASVLRDSSVQCKAVQVQSRCKIKQDGTVEAQKDFRLGGKDFESQLQSREFKLLNRGSHKLTLSSRISPLNRGSNKVTISSRISQPKLDVNNSVTVKENVNKKQLDRARIHNRRSAIPSVKLTPSLRINKDMNFRSLSKIGKFSESKFSQRILTKRIMKVEPHSNGTRRSVELPHSNRKRKSRRSVLRELPKITICPPEPEEVEETKSIPVVLEEKTKQPEMCDASTSTQILFTFGKSPNKDLVKETEQLIEEQEAISKKASLIREQTIARRQKMQESHALESFITSISPLKRLFSMIQEKPSFVNDASPSCPKSYEETDMMTETSAGEMATDARAGEMATNTSDYEMATDTSAFEMIMDTTIQSPDKSVYFEDSDTDVSVGNITQIDLNSSHMKWKHLKLNSRVFQTPSSIPKRTLKEASPVEEEKFDGKIEEDLSPFTEMAGDCERPSLAPMTPHSHHQVSMIKMSLRKQLNQLYDS